MARIKLYRPEIRRAVRAVIGPTVIGLFERLVGRKSWADTQHFGRRLGALGFRYHARYRRRTLGNLAYAFGDELSDEEARHIARECLEHHAMLFLEALRMPSMSEEEILGLVQIRGLEHLEAALEGGRGAVTFSGHFGNWEIGAVRLIYGKLPLIPLSKPPRSPRLARSIKGIRDRLGFPVIPISEGVKGIMRALKHNQLVPIMSDRFAWGKGLTVPFFGKPTHVWHTPAMMGQRAGCPIIPVHAIRQADGSYVIEVEPPVEQLHTGDRDFDVWVNTARCMAVLARSIRRAPAQFAWNYELWRPGYEFDPPYPFDRLQGLL